MSTIIQEDVDPSGDLILTVGSEQTPSEASTTADPQQTTIRVSSKVLSLALPVFAAMLGPKFAEGQSLLTRDSLSNEVLSIPLPDDDPVAMIWFCRALHHKLDVNKEEIDFNLCLRLATLSDKYDTSIALSGLSNSWIEPWRGSMTGDPRCLEALYIAYAFDNYPAFWRITRDTMQYYTAADLANLKDCWIEELLPPRLLGKLC